MSYLILKDPFSVSMRPSRILGQHFGLDLESEDLLAPLVSRETHNLMSLPGGYYRPWRSTASKQDTGSTLTIDKDQFQVNLDVQQFKPEEISVKITADNTVTVEGKHEEKKDEHGSIYRHFVRSYVLPKGSNIEKIDSKLSSDGVLTITAPRTPIENQEARSIPITQTGQPSKPAVEVKTTESGVEEKKKEVEDKKIEVEDKKIEVEDKKKEVEEKKKDVKEIKADAKKK